MNPAAHTQEPLPETPELLAVARRVVWFKEPAQALRDAGHLISHALTFGTAEDVRILRQVVSDETLRVHLQHAPAGVFDARSWAYWTLMLDLPAGLPMPKRSLP